MGDFFYYGQKDTIRRLNELAGRGAVVASYAPAVGRSPLGGPNGYMNPAWIDPGLPLNTRQVGVLGTGDAQPRIRVGATTEGEPSISLARWSGTGSNDMTYRMTNNGGEFRIEWSSSGQLGSQVFSPLLKLSSTGLRVNELLAVGDGAITTSFLSPGGVGMTAGQDRDSLRIGVGGVAGTSFPGCFSWFASAGNNNGTPNNLYKTSYRMALRAYDTQSNAWTSDLITVRGTGAITAPTLSVISLLDVGVANTEQQGIRKLAVNNCLIGYVVGGAYGNSAGSALNVATHTITGSSIRTGGTIGTSGNDYAEYIFKSSACSIVAPGQIVGITSDNKVTDKWADAVMFSIKSTAPSFVGGDSWANDVGPRPSPQAGPAPTQPLRREDVVTQQPVPGTNPPEYENVVTEPGDTDDEWAEKQAAYTAALAAHNIAVQQDAEDMATFDAALEAERQKVDRIAIAGRVPVNVQGAQPGDYIVPVQDGTGIKGIAVHEDDLSMKQYFRAVGRVISIEPDGRAYVMVKVV